VRSGRDGGEGGNVRNGDYQLDMQVKDDLWGRF